MSNTKIPIGCIDPARALPANGSKVRFNLIGDNSLRNGYFNGGYFYEYGGGVAHKAQSLLFWEPYVKSLEDVGGNYYAVICHIQAVQIQDLSYELFAVMDRLNEIESKIANL